MKNNLWSRSKRVLSLLLVLTMVVSICLPVSGHAATTGNTVELTVGQSRKLHGLAGLPGRRLIRRSPLSGPTAQ